MTSISATLSGDHQRCDAAFAEMEGAVSSGDWDRAAALFEGFDGDLRRHLDFEEQVLFPALAEEPGVPQGPTMVMTMEHEEMRALLADLRTSLEDRNAEDLLGEAETLLILLQQHNVKEEQVLYSLADEMLSPERLADISGQLEQWGIEAK